MAKPATLDGYSDQYTVDCERVLVTCCVGWDRGKSRSTWSEDSRRDISSPRGRPWFRRMPAPWTWTS
jgi:hypothetical protein